MVTIDAAPLTDEQLGQAIANTRAEYQRWESVDFDKSLAAWREHWALVAEQMHRKVRKAA